MVVVPAGFGRCHCSEGLGYAHGMTHAPFVCVRINSDLHSGLSGSETWEGEVSVVSEELGLQVVHYGSPLGPMALALQDGLLAGAWFAGQRFAGRTLPAPWPQHVQDEQTVCLLPAAADLPAAQATVAWLDAYFNQSTGSQDSPEPMPPLPALRLQGTDFQQEIWQLLLNIPFGQTVTYAQLGKRLGRPFSAQAVGGAVGKNPVSILVPCHRVIGTDGSLTGYAGGLERKRWLLAHEGAGCATVR